MASSGGGGGGSCCGGGSGRKRPRTATNCSLLIAAGAFTLASSSTTSQASAAELELTPPLLQFQAKDTSASAPESSHAPALSASTRCDRDNPSYRSRLGLSCPEHVEWYPRQTLAMGSSSPCDAYAIIGFPSDEVAALKWHCPRSCGIGTSRISGLSSAGTSGTSTSRGDYEESSCWYDDVDDNGRSFNTYLLHSSSNNDDAGFSDGDPDHAADIHSPAFGGDDDSGGGDKIRGRRNRQVQLQRSCHPGWSSTCQDDMHYFSKMRVPCWRHSTMDCTAFGHIGYTDEEILDLVERCPCSCGVECGTFSIAPSVSPTAMPTEGPTRIPSASPSVSFEPSANPSARPSQCELSSWMLDNGDISVRLYSFLISLPWHHALFASVCYLISPNQCANLCSNGIAVNVSNPM